jgi:hypothetical protein
VTGPVDIQFMNCLGEINQSNSETNTKSNGTEIWNPDHHVVGVKVEF